MKAAKSKNRCEIKTWVWLLDYNAFQFQVVDFINLDFSLPIITFVSKLPGAFGEIRDKSAIKHKGT